MPISGGFGIPVIHYWKDVEKAKKHLSENKKKENQRCKPLEDLLKNATEKQRLEIEKHFAIEIECWSRACGHGSDEHSGAKEALKAYCEKKYSNRMLARYICPSTVERIFGIKA